MTRFEACINPRSEPDDETDTKERAIESCLNGRSDSLNGGNEQGTIDLHELRSLCLSKGGLQCNRLRRLAWPKLVSSHQVLLWDPPHSQSKSDKLLSPWSTTASTMTMTPTSYSASISTPMSSLSNTRRRFVFSPHLSSPNPRPSTARTPASTRSMASAASLNTCSTWTSSSTIGSISSTLSHPTRSDRKRIKRLLQRTQWSKTQVSKSPRTFDELLGRIVDQQYSIPHSSNKSIADEVDTTTLSTMSTPPRKNTLSTYASEGHSWTSPTSLNYSPSPSNSFEHSPCLRISALEALPDLPLNPIFTETPESISIAEGLSPHRSKSRSKIKRRSKPHSKYSLTDEEDPRILTLQKDERHVLGKLMIHLKRVDASYYLFDGLQNMLAVLWIVLDTPSLTSVMSQQLMQSHWIQKKKSRKVAPQVGTSPANGNLNPSTPLESIKEDLYMELLLLWDPPLYYHFQDMGYSETPPPIQDSWIPTWFCQELRDLSILLRLWDAFLVSHPQTAIYFSVALTVHFREALLQAKQPEVFQAIIVNLPKDGLEHYDGSVVEQILTETLKGLASFPPRESSIDSSPGWLTAARAPTDYQVLQYLQRIREEDFVSKANNQSAASLFSSVDPALHDGKQEKSDSRRMSPLSLTVETQPLLEDDVDHSEVTHDFDGYSHLATDSMIVNGDVPAKEKPRIDIWSQYPTVAVAMGLPSPKGMEFRPSQMVVTTPISSSSSLASDFDGGETKTNFGKRWKWFVISLMGVVAFLLAFSLRFLKSDRVVQTTSNADKKSSFPLEVLDDLSAQEVGELTPRLLQETFPCIQDDTFADETLESSPNWYGVDLAASKTDAEVSTHSMVPNERVEHCLAEVRSYHLEVFDDLRVQHLGEQTPRLLQETFPCITEGTFADEAVENSPERNEDLAAAKANAEALTQNEWIEYGFAHALHSQSSEEDDGDEEIRINTDKENDVGRFIKEFPHENSYDSFDSNGQNLTVIDSDLAMKEEPLYAKQAFENDLVDRLLKKTQKLSSTAVSEAAGFLLENVDLHRKSRMEAREKLGQGFLHFLVSILKEPLFQEEELIVIENETQVVTMTSPSSIESKKPANRSRPRRHQLLNSAMHSPSQRFLALVSNRGEKVTLPERSSSVVSASTERRPVEADNMRVDEGTVKETMFQLPFGIKLTKESESVLMDTLPTQMRVAMQVHKVVHQVANKLENKWKNLRESSQSRATSLRHVWKNNKIKASLIAKRGLSNFGVRARNLGRQYSETSFKLLARSLESAEGGTRQAILALNLLTVGREAFNRNALDLSISYGGRLHDHVLSTVDRWNERHGSKGPNRRVRNVFSSFRDAIGSIRSKLAKSLPTQKGQIEAELSSKAAQKRSSGPRSTTRRAKGAMDYAKIRFARMKIASPVWDGFSKSKESRGEDDEDEIHQIETINGRTAGLEEFVATNSFSRGDIMQGSQQGSRRKLRSALWMVLVEKGKVIQSDSIMKFVRLSQMIIQSVNRGLAVIKRILGHIGPEITKDVEYAARVISMKFQYVVTQINKQLLLFEYAVAKLMKKLENQKKIVQLLLEDSDWHLVVKEVRKRMYLCTFSAAAVLAQLVKKLEEQNDRQMKAVIDAGETAKDLLLQGAGLGARINELGTFRKLLVDKGGSFLQKLGNGVMKLKNRRQISEAEENVHSSVSVSEKDTVSLFERVSAEDDLICTSRPEVMRA